MASVLNKRGGTRAGSGRKNPYGEPTKQVKSMVPASREVEFKQFVKKQLKKWHMKKIITVIALAILSVSVIAQPYASFNATTTGVEMKAGCLTNPNEIGNAWDISIGYLMPLFNNENERSAIASASIGRMITLSNKDANNYSVTPIIGAGYFKRKDFKAYYADPTGKTGIKVVEGVKPMIGIEAGKDARQYRAFVSASYCDGAYGGIGLRIFLNRN